MGSSVAQAPGMTGQTAGSANGYGWVSVAPGRVDFALGYTCNNGCRLCLFDAADKARPALSAQQARVLLDTAPGPGGRLVFTGGEPTLRPDLAELAARAVTLGFAPVCVQTNGRALRSLPYARRLVAAGVAEFEIAVHGARPALHETLTRVPGSLAETLAGLHHARALGARVVVASVLTRANYRHAAELVRLLRHWGIAGLRWVFPKPQGTALELLPATIPRFELAAPYVKEALDHARHAGIPAWVDGAPDCMLADLARGADRPPAAALLQDRCHGPPCTDCGRRATCAGVWTEYAREYGWGEFSPLAPSAAGDDRDR